MLKIAIFLLMLGFYGAYFSKMMMQKKQGVKTDNLGRGAKDIKTFFREIFLKGLTYLMALVQIYALLVDKHFLRFTTLNLTYLGFLLALLGFNIFVISVITMGKNFRAGIDLMSDTDLITNGIYRFSRNPVFLGFDLFYFGVALALNSLLLLILTFLAVILFHLQILAEERFLRVKFGEKYLKYQKKVPRYFRKITIVNSEENIE